MMKRGLLFLLMVILLFSAASAEAKRVVDGLTSPYKVIIDDEINLLTSDEINRLVDKMMPLTKYGTVVFRTLRVSFRSEESLAREYLDQNVSRDVNFSCTSLHINMGTRQLWLQSRCDLLRIVSINAAYTITNNVAGRATKAQYYECAAEAFSQINTLAKGGRVLSPMRYICSFLFAAAGCENKYTCDNCDQY